jgi:hypothetical protein
MREKTLGEKELAFIGELEKYEDKWVAILRNSEEETIVGSGASLKEAKRSAEERGFVDVVFMKVPSSHKVLILLSL